MKIAKLILWSALPVVIVVGVAAAGAVGRAQPEVHDAVTAPQAVDVPEVVPAVVEAEAPRIDAHVEALASWLGGVISGWPKTSPDIEQVDLDGLAHDISTAAVDDGKPDDAAMLLAAIGFFESGRFAVYVDSQQCNDWMRVAWAHGRAVPTGVMSVITGREITHIVADKTVLPKDEQKILAYGDCDGGAAYSIWQIHPGDYGVTAEQLRDRVFAARLALSIARRDLSRYTTGENARALASAALRKHPFELPRE